MLKVLIALAAMAACASASSSTAGPSTEPGSGEVNSINLGSAALCLSDGEAAFVLTDTGLVSVEDIVDVVEVDGDLLVILDTNRVDPDTILSIIAAINAGAFDGGCAGNLVVSGANADTVDYDNGSLAKIIFCTTGGGPVRRGKSSKKSSKGGEVGNTGCVEIVQPRAGKTGKKNKKGGEKSGKSKKSKKSGKSMKSYTQYRAAAWSTATAAQKSVYVLGSMATVAVGLALVVAGIRRKNKRAGYREIENAEEKPKQTTTSEDAKESSPFLTKI
jgi:hypothetical protein